MYLTHGGDLVSYFTNIGWSETLDMTLKVKVAACVCTRVKEPSLLKAKYCLGMCSFALKMLIFQYEWKFFNRMQNKNLWPYDLNDAPYLEIIFRSGIENQFEQFAPTMYMYS
jgi:hypothetical protein